MRQTAVAMGVMMLVAACSADAVTGDKTTLASDPPSTLSCWSSSPADGQPFAFENVTEDLEIVDPLRGMFAHAAIWGDVNNDGWVDLYVGTFADRDPDAYSLRDAQGPAADQLLMGSPAGFGAAVIPEVRSRTSGGLAADLDNDGDLDLVVTRNIKEDDASLIPSQILENRDGELVIVKDAGFPALLGGRSVAAFDYDDDGLVDLFVTEDRWTGGNSRLLKNLGEIRFVDVTGEAGLPDDVHGLGVAVADFDGDTRPDLFVSGSNRMFMLGDDSRFVEANTSVFEWDYYGDEDDVAGIAVADLNRDGHIDIVLGQHFNSTVDFGREVPVRLYINDGSGGFTDVTEPAGLAPLPTKAPHVAIEDLDNDGWPEILTSATADGEAAIFRHLGVDDGLPRFEAPTGLGSDHYWVSAVTADYDRDGRLDMFLVEPSPELPSILLRNVSASGNWLEVSVEPGNGLGWKVEVRYDGELVGARPITSTQGYSAGVEPVAHFGLGANESVEVVLMPPHGGDEVVIQDVAANQRIRWPSGC